MCLNCNIALSNILLEENSVFLVGVYFDHSGDITFPLLDSVLLICTNKQSMERHSEATLNETNPPLLNVATTDASFLDQSSLP